MFSPLKLPPFKKVNIKNVTLFPQAVKNKYSSQKQMRIATISQLNSSLIKDLAKKQTL